MHKKIVIACIVFAAFAAFVVAPTASATVLTEPTKGGPKHIVSVGASITATATETKFTAGSSTVTCSHAHMTGQVTTNNGTVAAVIPADNGVFTGTATGGDCTSTNLGPVKPTVNSTLCLHVSNSDLGTITGCDGAVVTFTLFVTNLGLACKYQTGSVSWGVTTESQGQDAKVNVFEQPVIRESGQNIFCPSEGKLDMEFVLTTTDGTTLTFSS